MSDPPPPPIRTEPVERAVTAVEMRTGRASLIHHITRYVFPDHWSFMWGEIALYCFVVLIMTGTYLALFFDPSYHEIVYHGVYAPLRGQKMSEAYASTLNITWSVKLGLLMRQTHHWAADLFVAAITVHMLRVFFTGAFRRPRDLLYWTGLTLLLISVLEGYMGYSLVDDLLSGMGLAIGWAVAMSLPIVGGPLATLLWGGRFPGTSVFESRLFISHVFIVPLVIAGLIGLHLLLVSTLHHTQFAGRGVREQNVVGSPLWPSYTMRSLGLFGLVTGLLFMLGALVQINPIWLWGPYHPYVGENGAQPDWYLGWLIGALRMMPNWEITVGGKTLVPNPFWGGALFPLLVFAILYAWPVLDRRVTGDRAAHHILQRPRDAPRRTAVGVALFTFTAVPFFAGAMDRVYFEFGIPYVQAMDVMRVLWLVLPVITGLITLWCCRTLRRERVHPLRGAVARTVGRDPIGGGFRVQGGISEASIAAAEERTPDPPVATGHKGRLALAGAGGLGALAAIVTAAALPIVAVVRAVLRGGRRDR
jgi:ubiquinol-cytochrome c reductase cytochrome b subunit